mmetsp:Transcript_67534/g.162125  ORF Transcript_67534/g.162125 Transcript_67534/m.162125 type:complete len:496 (-) Transcript_67534:190-1677(-)
MEEVDIEETVPRTASKHVAYGGCCFSWLDHVLERVRTRSDSGGKTYMNLIRAASRILHVQTFELMALEDEESALSRLADVTVIQAIAADRRGRNALHVAAAAGHPRVCQLLLNLGRADPWWCNAADTSGKTALHWAADRGHHECCEVLLTSPCFSASSYIDQHGQTALHMAVVSGHAKVCESLLSTVLLEGQPLPSRVKRSSITKLAHVTTAPLSIFGGAGTPWAFPAVDLVDGTGLTALHYAADSGREDCVQALVGQSRRTVNALARDLLGCTALHRAAAQGHIKVCQVLLACRNGSELANQVDRYANTPLHIATMNGQHEACKVLLRSSKFSSANAFNEVHRTALHEAAVKGDIASSQAIVTTRAKGMLGSYVPFTAFGAVDDYGRTALHLAVSGGHTALVQAMLDTLLPNDALNLKDRDGRTALHYAALFGNSEIFQAILEEPWFDAGEEEDSDGNTAVELATGDVLQLIQRMYSVQGQRLEEAKVIEGKFL